VESATWDSATGATIQIRTANETDARFAVSSALKNITCVLDDQTVLPTVIKQRNQWTENSLFVPAGHHCLKIKGEMAQQK
jgi:hypothetical protein